MGYTGYVDHVTMTLRVACEIRRDSPKRYLEPIPPVEIPEIHKAQIRGESGLSRTPRKVIVSLV